MRDELKECLRRRLVNRLSSRGWGEEKAERKRIEEKGGRPTLHHSPLGHFLSASSFVAVSPDNQIINQSTNQKTKFNKINKPMPRSHQSLNVFKSCLVKHGLKLFSL